MRRRDFIRGILGLVSGWPLAARAEPTERVKRIGVLHGYAESDADARLLVNVLIQRLQDLGWTSGRNLHVEYRWGAGDRGRAQMLAQELLGMQLEVIVACAGPPAFALCQATRSIPIVFVQVVDPVALGIVETLARPGTNCTGFTHFESAVVGKWVDILKEVSPNLIRGGIIFDPDSPASNIYLHAIETVPPSLGIQLIPIGVRDASDIEHTINLFAREPNSGLLVVPGPAAIDNRELIFRLAAHHKLPVVYPHAFFAREGGLISYGVDLPDMYRRSASYVDRIMRGEKPADLPVQAPTKYELIVNLKTAKALGLNVPPTLLGRADEVIE
jgi:putative ABC transport system substrate-binding protein